VREYFPTLLRPKALVLAPILLLAVVGVIVFAAKDPGLFVFLLFALAATIALFRRYQRVKELKDQGAINIFSLRPSLILFSDRIRTPAGDFRLTPNVRASVETSGSLAVTQRLTVTRMLAFGIFSLAAPKKSKTDTRKLYVLVDGDRFQSVVAIKPNRETAARKFAAQVTTQARQSLPAQPASGTLGPGGRFPSPTPTGIASASSFR
jgi:hypothetical protein